MASLAVGRTNVLTQERGRLLCIWQSGQAGVRLMAKALDCILPSEKGALYIRGPGPMRSRGLTCVLGATAPSPVFQRYHILWPLTIAR